MSDGGQQEVTPTEIPLNTNYFRGICSSFIHVPLRKFSCNVPLHALVPLTFIKMLHCRAEGQLPERLHLFHQALSS